MNNQPVCEHLSIRGCSNLGVIVEIDMDVTACIQQLSGFDNPARRRWSTHRQMHPCEHPIAAFEFEAQPDRVIRAVLRHRGLEAGEPAEG